MGVGVGGREVLAGKQTSVCCKVEHSEMRSRREPIGAVIVLA